MVANVALAWAIAGAPEIAADPDPQSIVGGVPTEPGEFDDVVELHLPSGNTCSGVVVAPRVVLTAAHCVVSLQDTDVVRVGYGAPDAGLPLLESVGFGAHPAYDPDPQHIDIHDYGYVLLGTDFMLADGYVELIDTQAEWDEAMVEGREVTVVGYGEDGSDSASAGIKRKVDLTISRFSELGLEFFAGGDQLDSCRGDSGGPAFVRMDDGSLRLAGIVSRGTMVCGTGGWYGAPYPALCWVDAETDAGLSGACNTCDCLDMTPKIDEGCCSIAAPNDTRGWWLALAFVLTARRRRCRTRR